MYYCRSGDGTEGWVFQFNGNIIENVSDCAGELGLMHIDEVDSRTGEFVPDPENIQTGRRVILLKGEVKILRTPEGWR